MVDILMIKDTIKVCDITRLQSKFNIIETEGLQNGIYKTDIDDVVAQLSTIIRLYDKPLFYGMYAIERGEMYLKFYLILTNLQYKLITTWKLHGRIPSMLLLNNTVVTYIEDCLTTDQKYDSKYYILVDVPKNRRNELNNLGITDLKNVELIYLPYGVKRKVILDRLDALNMNSKAMLLSYNTRCGFEFKKNFREVLWSKKSVTYEKEQPSKKVLSKAIREAFSEVIFGESWYTK